MTNEPIHVETSISKVLLRRLSLLLMIICASVSPTFASDAMNQHTDFDIAAQPIVSALHEWSRQSNVQIMVASEEVAGQRTEGVSGRLTAAAALARLLQRTNLTYEAVGENTVNVKRVMESTNSKNSKTDEVAPKRARSQETGDARRTMEEVVVTAQKREERLEDVPISISVLSGARLDNSTSQGVTEAISRVPGVAVNVTYLGGGTQLVSRGVTASGAISSGSGPISYYLDSVPFGFVRHAITPDTNAYDLKRVEVLRGPQGTLYGASAQNGVVRVLTNDANPDALEFKARTAVSNTDGASDLNYRADMALNVPIVEGKLAARAVVGYQDLAGWINRPNKKDVNDAELKNLRFKINAQPSEQLSIGLSAWLSRSDFGGPSTSNDDFEQVALLDEPISSDFDTFGLRVAYQLSSVAITSSTSYIDYTNNSARDLIYFAPDFLSIDHFDSRVFSEEIILNSVREGAWKWSLGGMYRDAKDRQHPEVQFLPAPPMSEADFDYASKSYAVFGELTRLLLDGHLELTAGLRYFKDDVTLRERSNIDGLLPLVNEDSEFDEISPRLVTTWHLNDRMTLYASYAEGFRSGFNQSPSVTRFAPDIGPAEPDTLTNYEIGAKGNAWNGRLSVEAAVYYIDWQDVQQQLTVRNNDTFLSALINSESASGMGVDFGVTVRPVDRLEAGVNVSYNDLAMDSDVLSRNAVLFSKGDRLNLSPEYTLGGWVDYATPLGRNGVEGLISVSANYTSEMDVRTIVAEGQGGVQSIALGDAMLIARASLGLRTPSGWAATLFVDNINNEKGSPVRFPFVPGVINDWDARVQPRTVGAQLEYRF